jgi:hypothetical protein
MDWNETLVYIISCPDVPQAIMSAYCITSDSLGYIVAACSKVILGLLCLSVHHTLIVVVYAHLMQR